MAHEQQQHEELLAKCLDYERKHEQLCETVAHLPAKMISMRLAKGIITPIEAKLRVGTAFFGVYDLSRQSEFRWKFKGDYRQKYVIHLDVAREELLLHGARGRKVQVYPLTALGPLLPGYRSAFFSATRAGKSVTDFVSQSSSTSLGIGRCDDAAPLVFECESTETRDELYAALRAALDKAPYEPRHVLHAGWLWYCGRSIWVLLLPSQLLLLEAPDSAIPFSVLSLIGATVKVAPLLSLDLVIRSADGGKCTFSAAKASELSHWIPLLSKLVVMESSRNKNVESGSGQRVEEPQLSPHFFLRLSAQLNEADLQIALLQNELATAEGTILEALSSASTQLMGAARRMGARVGKDFLFPESRHVVSQYMRMQSRLEAHADSNDLERARYLNEAVRAELRAKDRDLFLLQHAVLAFSSPMWEWASPVTEFGPTLWQVWVKAYKLASSLSECGTVEETCASTSEGQAPAESETSLYASTTDHEVAPTNAEDQSVYVTNLASSGTTLGGGAHVNMARNIITGTLELISPRETGAPLGVIDPSDAQVMGVEHPSRRRQGGESSDWLIRFANKILEM